MSLYIHICIYLPEVLCVYIQLYTHAGYAFYLAASVARNDASYPTNARQNKHEEVEAASLCISTCTLSPIILTTIYIYIYM